ncbi:hypothetical protein ACPUD8_18125 [Brevibacterium sp. FAM 25378]|uniref:hypothetical protein n=1 Tax=unclassified Brevibacterium TaxID=2614124 RepID=UPI001092DA19|nr:hypothetical protein [Brevibacterium sp. S22]TGD27613.1 hypothetical protein EB835_18480 [Brevibacterium sp. S22]
MAETMAERTLAAALEKEHCDIEEYIEAADAGHGDPAPLRRSMTGLRQHIYLEETFLFTPMCASMASCVNAMDGVDTMLDEDAGDEATRNACRELLSLLDKHNSKEEPTICTRADKLLSAEASGKLADFLDAGTMPDGWVREKAGQSDQSGRDRGGSGSASAALETLTPLGAVGVLRHGGVTRLLEFSRASFRASTIQGYSLMMHLIVNSRMISACRKKRYVSVR